jgi:hypothetical protein
VDWREVIETPRTGARLVRKTESNGLSPGSVVPDTNALSINDTVVGQAVSSFANAIKFGTNLLSGIHYFVHQWLLAAPSTARASKAVAPRTSLSEQVSQDYTDGVLAIIGVSATKGTPFRTVGSSTAAFGVKPRLRKVAQGALGCHLAIVAPEEASQTVTRAS